MKMTWPSGREAALVDILNCVGPGWSGILVRLVADLERLGWDGSVLQVKEKFGGLRFYIDSGSDAIDKCIIKAERESYRTCECCGQPGKCYDDGWMVTLCRECREKQLEGRNRD